MRDTTTLPTSGKRIQRAYVGAGRPGLRGTRNADTGAVVVMTKLAVPEPEPGVTPEGENMQLDSAGEPEQESFTWLLKDKPGRAETTTL